MRRKQIIKPLMTECYPLFFWKTCCACGYQFRRERGWQKEATDIAFMPLRYICATCAPNESVAAEIFDSRPWRAQLPAVAPKAPPRGR